MQSGKLELVLNAPRDGTLTQRTFVFLSVIFALLGMKLQENVKPVTTDISSQKENVLRTTMLVLYPKAISFARLGLDNLVLNVQTEPFSIPTEYVPQLVLFAILSINLQETALLVLQDMIS